MHSVGLSEDWQQIKKDSGLGVMEQILLRILDCGLRRAQPSRLQIEE